MKHTDLSEKELKTYNIKLKNSYYYDNSFYNEDNSFNLINSLEKREALYSYFFSKIDFFFTLHIGSLQLIIKFSIHI